MRRFLSSAWFPLLACIVFACATVVAFVILKPTGSDVANDAVLRAFKIAGWVAGPVMGLLSFLLIGILNLVRRLLRIRSVGIFHSIVIILGLAPWLIFGWELTTVEPRYTDFARAAIDFVGAPMLYGSLVACVCAALLGFLGLLSKDSSS